MKITRTSGIGIHKPVCLVDVRVSQTVETRTLSHRKYVTKRRGIPETACGGRATYIVDGCDMCDRHAGQAALRFLIDNQ